MCRAVGYRVSLPPNCKNNTMLRHRNPHPAVKLISNSNSGEYLLCMTFVSILFRVDMASKLAAFCPLIPYTAIILCFHLYSKVCIPLKRKWESPVSYHANKPALFIYKCKVDLLSQLI